MAPNTVTSSQDFLIQAAQKLSATVTETGTAPNEFAKNLLELLEVSTKINQFDEMVSTANEETTSVEAQQWREISLLTMQHARTHLVEQQQRLIEKLRDLSECGASLYKAPEVPLDQTDVKPLPGADPEAKLNQMAVKPPPGLAAPPGLSTTEVTNCKSLPPSPPAALKPPPGLASAGTAPVTPPPGFNAPANRKPLGRTPKKEATVHPWRINKKGNDGVTSLYEARFSKEDTERPTSSVLNLDAYESD